MKKVLTGILGISLWCGPAIWAQGSGVKGKDQAETKTQAAKQSEDRGMSEDMRQAIEFERNKDQADERQARLEARHPSVPPADASHGADRSVDESGSGQKAVKPGSGGKQ
jgi:hypothetical protein